MNDFTKVFEYIFLKENNKINSKKIKLIKKIIQLKVTLWMSLRLLLPGMKHEIVISLYGKIQVLCGSGYIKTITFISKKYYQTLL